MKKNLDIDTYLDNIENLWPSWKKEIKKHCINGGIYCWYLEGERGCGMSTATIWTLLWKLYELLSEEDPHSKYGFVPGSTFTLSVFSEPYPIVGTERGELKSILSEWCDIVDWKYWVERPDGFTFGSYIELIVTNKEENLLGTNLYSFVHESTGMYPEKGWVYEEMLNRLLSRFKQNGAVPGIAIYARSIGFGERYTREGMMQK